MPRRTPATLAFTEPMAATKVAELPRGPEWSYEIKLDGYRVLAVKSGDDVRLLSRRNKDLTRDFPSVATAVRGVRATTVMLDGEIVAVDENGVPRFQALQHRSRTRPEQIVYYAFDILQLAGPGSHRKAARRTPSRLGPMARSTSQELGAERARCARPTLARREPLLRANRRDHAHHRTGRPSTGHHWIAVYCSRGRRPRGWTRRDRLRDGPLLGLD